MEERRGELIRACHGLLLAGMLTESIPKTTKGNGLPLAFPVVGSALPSSSAELLVPELGEAIRNLLPKGRPPYL